jgi:hypothetical protein
VSTPPRIRPERGPAGGDGCPDAERPVALLALGEHDGQQRQRGGGQQRAAEPLQRAGGDEQRRVLRQAAEQRGDGEDDRAQDEDLAPADAVGQLAAEQQEAAEGEA